MRKGQHKTRASFKPREPRPPSSPGRRRWAWATAILAGLVLTALLVERLTRPTDLTLVIAEGGHAPAEMAQGNTAAAPPPVEASMDELIAEGKKLAEEIAVSFPGDPDALAMSGRLYYGLGAATKAIPLWEKSIQMNPKGTEAWLGIAQHAHQQGDFEKAIEAMRRLEETAPDVAKDKIFLLADSFMKSGRTQEAVEVLEAVGKSEPLPAWAHLMLGQGYNQLKDYPRAAEAFRKAIASNPGASSAHYGLSVALARMGQAAESAKAREAYVETQKKNMVVFDRMQRAGSQEERADPKALAPLVAFFHVEAGRLYAVSGQADRARSHWTRAQALAPDRPEPQQLLSALGPP